MNASAIRGWCDDAPLTEDLRLQHPEFAQMLADSAPEPRPLTPGRPVKIFRVGKLYDRDGKFIDDIDDALLADIVRVFEARRGAEKIPIDWNHGTAIGDTPATSMAFGRVVGLRHVPGVGLWMLPEYTDLGVRIIRDSQGVLETSPEYRRCKVVNQSTGEALGMAEILAVALTNRPRQNALGAEGTVALSNVPAPTPAHTAETLADSHRPEEEAMSGDNPGTQAPAVSPGLASPPAAAPAPAAPAALADPPAPEEAAAEASVEDQLKQAKAENASLRQEIEALKVKHEAMSTTASSQLSARTTEHTLLSKRVAKLEADNESERKARKDAERTMLFDRYEHNGLVAPGNRPAYESWSQKDPEGWALKLSQLQANPEIANPGERLSSPARGPAAPPPKTKAELLHDRIVAHGKAKGLDPENNDQDYVKAHADVVSTRQGGV